MDLTGVIPQCIQPPESTLQHQSLLHLPPTSSCPLPTIPTSTQPEQSLSPQHNNEQHQFSPHNQHHHFSLNNIENHPFYDTNQPFPSHNTQYHPFYDTQVPFSPSYPNVTTGPPIYHSNGNHQHNNTPPFSQRYPTPLYLPTIKELSAPSTPTYPFSWEGWIGVPGLKRWWQLSWRGYTYSGTLPKRGWVSSLTQCRRWEDVQHSWTHPNWVSDECDVTCHSQ